MKTKQQKLKSLSIPAFISGIFGVTEPAIYGVTLPLKKPFIMSCIGGAIGGGVLGFAGSKIYMIGGFGIFEYTRLILIQKQVLRWDSGELIIAIVVSFVFGFILTYLFGFDKETMATTVDEAAATLKEMNRKEVGSQMKKIVLLARLKEK